MFIRHIAVFAFVSILTACGGGSSTSSNPSPPPPTNAAPTVDAGTDATMRLPTGTVSLDGTVTDDGLPAGAAVSTVWTVQSGPAGATFADPNAVDTTVTFVSEGTYDLLLTADDTALQGSDTVQVIVEAAPAVGVVTVSPPAVTLSTGGTQAFSASGTDQYGDAIAVNVTWSATGGTIDAAGDYTAGAVAGDFVVTATDGAVAGTANVTISASAPTANAGGPYAGVEGASVALDGSGSTDPNNDITDYDWDLDNDGAYDDATGVGPTFAAGGSGIFTIGLRVTDADGTTSTDTTTVSISNIAPVAEAGGPYSGGPAVDIPLNGSTSSDPGNDIVAYEWDLDNDGTYETPGVSVNFNSPTNGNFTVGLRVTDDDGASGTDTATVTIDGPVHAYWSMNEGSPSLIIADTVLPDDGTGTINGATWTTGVSGAALDFDGTNDRVVIENTPSLRITGTEISLHAWIFPHNGGGADGGRIISKSADVGDNEVFAMAVNDYRVVFRIDGQDIASSHIVVLNEWVHVAMVYDGTDVRIYINGQLDAATPVAKSDPIDDSSRAVHLGTWEGFGRWFNGVIDEVQIFNSAVIPPVVLPPGRGAGLFFEDITLAAGTSGPVAGGHGVMFAEVDNDFLPDYYLTNSIEGVPNRSDFFFDNTNGSFFAEVAGARGIADTDGGSHGAVWADLDNDGDYDLVNGTTWDNLAPSTGNPDSDNVFRNDGPGSPGVFTEVTPASIQAVLIETRGITAFDMDADGDLDLFGVPGLGATLGANAAFLNDLIVTGVPFAFSSHVGGALSTAFAMEGVTDTDYDGDGDIDILAASLFGNIIILDNKTAPPDSNPGFFSSIPPASLGITDSASHGVTTADVDNDGDLDLLLVNNGNAYLYRRENDGTYTKVQSFADVEGFMGGFADLNNNSELDLVFAGDEKVYLNIGGTFGPGQSVPVSEISGPRAIAFADIDSDGDLDFAITAKDSRNWLVRNDLDLGPRNWLRVELVSPQCQAGAFGAKVKLFKIPGDGGTFISMREAKGNHGYLAQDDPVLHFGLGTIPTVDVVVDWVDGSQTTVSNVDVTVLPRRILIDACPP